MTRVIPTLKRMVVKIGTSSLCGLDGSIDRQQIDSLTRQIAQLKQQSIQVVLVSSGAVAAGAAFLHEKTHTLENMQAAAAIGQPLLMAMFQKYFLAYGLTTAQLLLTHDDFQCRRRYLNARNTLNYLLNNDIVPIINENDTISTQEIRFSDNDFLSALCTNLIHADLLLILSNIDGIASKDPLRFKDVQIFSSLTLADLKHLAKTMPKESSQSMGRGGILTKLQAPLMAARYGVPSIIANSREPNVLERLVAGEGLGTFVMPEKNQLNAWQAYIAHALKAKASVTIDLGAAAALRKKNASLLASGIVSTHGSFERGDAIACCLPDGQEVARGIVEYSQIEVQKILGCHSDEIDAILGYQHRRSVIYRDNIVTY